VVRRFADDAGLRHGRYGRLYAAKRLVLQAVLKNELWFKVKEEVKRQPEEYMKYFEDCLFTSDAEIGP
jgi:hypothetical protein